VEGPGGGSAHRRQLRVPLRRHGDQLRGILGDDGKCSMVSRVSGLKMSFDAEWILNPRELWVFDNDALAFGSESLDADVFGTVVLLQHPQPNRVLVLGGSLEGLAREALFHAPQRVDVVEIDERALALLRPLLPGATVASLQSSRVHMHIGDGRGAIESFRDVDVLLVGSPEPSSAQANRYYTREFLEQCAAVLAPGGVVGLRLHAAENYWTAAQRERIDAELGAFTRQLPPRELMERLQAAGVPAGMVQRSSDHVLDPQLLHRQFFRPMLHPEMGEVPYEGHQFRIGGYDSGPRFPAPCLGEHSLQVLQEILGYSDEDLARVAASGALR
jgi:hypothetical protein